MSATHVMTRCPRCKEQVVAVILGGEGHCQWCGHSWPVNHAGVRQLDPQRPPAPLRRARTYDPIPKPARRIRDPQAGREKLRIEGKCRVCKAPGVYATDDNAFYSATLTRHHLVPRIQGGDDVDDNLVPLCGDGTRGCHHDVEQHRAGAREALRYTLTQPEVDYVTAKKSRAWLDKNYPAEGGGSGSDNVNAPRP